VTADFGDFREVKHLLIIFSLYRFEFHTKTLIFTVFVYCVEFCVNQAAFAFCFSALIGRKVRLKPIEVYGDTAPTDKSCRDFDVSRMEISALKTSLTLDSQKNSKN